MNSKVIKWFKRQASIRRFTDKSEDKASCAQNSAEDKRKRNFPRLSFRKRNKKTTSSASDIEGSLAVVGISKRFSQSMPQEIESETKDLSSGNCASNSVMLGNFSLTESPSKTDGYRSVSELSYHSSFDYSRETNESISLGEKQSAIAEINEEKDVSDISKPSTYDNQQTFHSVSSSFTSIIKDQPNSPNRTTNAPIVKMEEICDNVSDKEHPVEIHNIDSATSSASSNSYINANKNSDSVGVYDNVLPANHVSVNVDNGKVIKKEDSGSIVPESHVTVNVDNVKVIKKKDSGSIVPESHVTVNVDNVKVIKKEDSDSILANINVPVNADKVKVIKKEKGYSDYVGTAIEAKLANNNHSEKIYKVESSSTQDVFEEIDRLVRDASSLIDEESEKCNDFLSAEDSKQTCNKMEELQKQNAADSIIKRKDASNDLEEHLTVLKIVEPGDNENALKPSESFGSLSTDECSKSVEACLENLSDYEHDDDEIQTENLVENESPTKSVSHIKEETDSSKRIPKSVSTNTSNLYPTLQASTTSVSPEPEILLSDTQKDRKTSGPYVSPQSEAIVPRLKTVNENISAPGYSLKKTLYPKLDTCKSPIISEPETVHKDDKDPGISVPIVDLETEESPCITSKKAANEAVIKLETDVSSSTENEESVPYVCPETKAVVPCRIPKNETDLDMSNTTKPETSVSYVIKEAEPSVSYPEPNVSYKLAELPNDSLHSVKNHSHEGGTTPLEITISHPSPKKQEASLVHTSTPSKLPLDYYPQELNPFGDDSDMNDETSIEVKTFSNNNNRVTQCKENGIFREENVSNQVKGETKLNQGHTAMHPNERSCRPKNEMERTSKTTGYPSTSLNPFGDSDDDEEPGSPLDATNPFREEEQWHGITSEYPPRLPPKSGENQKRTSSRGSLAPVPHPRRSKQSHHGSYTSLQNVSMIPVPAPRSMTPSGSSRTLNESAFNPFEDEEDIESDDRKDFNRQSLGRCSMQIGGSSMSVQEPFGRSEVRGSLPPSARFKIRTKKRQAPQPPGLSNCKPPRSPTDPKQFTSLPRKRSSTSSASDFRTFDKRSPTARDNSPHRIPPPRPPPPKI